MDCRLTLLFIDGFDDRRTTNNFFDLIKGWTTEGGNADITAGLGRFGSQGVDLLTNNSFIRRPIPNTDLTIILGMAIDPNTLTGADNDWFVTLFSDSNTFTQFTFGLRVDGSIGAYRGQVTTLLGQTAPNILTPTQTFHYLELKVLISDTVGTVDVVVDDVNVLALTGQDTRQGGTNAWIDGVDYRGANGFGWRGDDLYIANTDGGLNNDFLGDVTVETKYPNAEGTTIQWTPSTGTDNSATIDEQPPDGVDINSDSTPGNIDMYETQNITDVSNTIYGVQVMSTIKKDTAGARKFLHRIDSNAVIQTKDDQVLTTGTQYLYNMIEADPDGGALWTGAKYNAAEFGVETRA